MVLDVHHALLMEEDHWRFTLIHLLLAFDAPDRPSQKVPDVPSVSADLEEVIACSCDSRTRWLCVQRWCGDRSGNTCTPAIPTPLYGAGVVERDQPVGLKPAPDLRFEKVEGCFSDRAAYMSGLLMHGVYAALDVP